MSKVILSGFRRFLKWYFFFYFFYLFLYPKNEISSKFYLPVWSRDQCSFSVLLSVSWCHRCYSKKAILLLVLSYVFLKFYWSKRIFKCSVWIADGRIGNRLLIKDAISNLTQVLAVERLLRMMENTFYFILRALFTLKIFKFLFWLFDHVGEQLN